MQSIVDVTVKSDVVPSVKTFSTSFPPYLIERIRLDVGTATMLSATMMLEYLGFTEESRRFENAIRKVYGEGKALTVDQGGKAKTAEFTAAVIASL